MATPGELMEVIGQSLGIPVASITGYDRHLADAGLRTKIGRGRHVAAVTAADAANLIVAILGGGQVKDAVATVQRYKQTEPHAATSTKGGFVKLGVTTLTALPEEHSFVDAIEALIVAVTGGSLPSVPKSRQTTAIIEVAALTPGTVGDIRLSGIGGKSANVRYALPHPFSGKSKATRKEIESWQARIKVQPQSDLEQFRKISERTIIAVGRLLAA
jgi:hypothetical protein